MKTVQRNVKEKWEAELEMSISADIQKDLSVENFKITFASLVYNGIEAWKKMIPPQIKVAGEDVRNNQQRTCTII